MCNNNKKKKKKKKKSSFQEEEGEEEILFPGEKHLTHRKHYVSTSYNILPYFSQSLFQILFSNHEYTSLFFNAHSIFQMGITVLKFH